MAGLVPAIHEKSCHPYRPTSHSSDARGLDPHDDQPAERDLVPRRHSRPYSARMAASRGIGWRLHEAIRADAARVRGASSRYQRRHPAREDNETLATYLEGVAHLADQSRMGGSVPVAESLNAVAPSEGSRGEFTTARVPDDFFAQK